MEEMPYARYVLPALLVMLAFGSFLIIATSGSDQPPVRPLETPAQVDPTGGRGKQKKITVKSGDTASTIAQHAGMTVDRLQALNPGVALDTLRPGQRLRLAR
jgi:LysM repeat protein